MLNKEHKKNIFKRSDRLRLSPSQIIVAGFLMLILVGSVLLSLPISSQNGQATGFIDAMFTATSAVCVTGLIVLDTGTYWSVFGKTVILFLIQVGGLGFMSLATLGALIMGKKINLRERMIIQESLNQYSLEGIVKLNKAIFLGTMLIEAVGAILLSIVFVPQFGMKKGIAFGIFHSVSAFCNAGFDLIGRFRSMTLYVSNPLLNGALMLLIISGGLGFTVIFELFTKRKFSKLSLHARVVLVMSALLIIVPFFLFFLMEYNNPQTIQSFSFVDKCQSMLFQSVSPRTAGFNTLPLDKLRDGSKFLTILLMFIGGSPASTAGGVKTVSIAVLLLCIRALIKGKETVEAGKKRISYQTVDKALAVVALGILIVVTGTMILSMTETNIDFLSILFEVVSACGTVGLTLGITPTLSVVGRLVLIVIMFSGRVGALTILLALASREKKELYRYPEEKVMVG